MNLIIRALIEYHAKLVDWSPRSRDKAKYERQLMTKSTRRVAINCSLFVQEIENDGRAPDRFPWPRGCFLRRSGWLGPEIGGVRGRGDTINAKTFSPCNVAKKNSRKLRTEERIVRRFAVARFAVWVIGECVRDRFPRNCQLASRYYPSISPMYATLWVSHFRKKV